MVKWINTLLRIVNGKLQHNYYIPYQHNFHFVLTDSCKQCLWVLFPASAPDVPANQRPSQLALSEWEESGLSRMMPSCHIPRTTSDPPNV